MSVRELVADKERLEREIEGWEEDARGLQEKINALYTLKAAVVQALDEACNHDYKWDDFPAFGRNGNYRCRICGLVDND